MPGNALSNRVIHLLIILVAGLVIYSNTFGVPFYMDDFSYIEDNPLIRDGGYFLSPSRADNLVLSRNLSDTWGTRFLSYLSFWANYKMGGMDVAGFHLVNMIIHTINAVLVYMLVVLAFRTPRLSTSDLADERLWIALLASLIFVSHPVQTEAVTYISQRFATLCTLFYLGSLVSYVWSRLSVKRFKRYGLYLLSLLSAVAAMKTKEIAFTLPIVITLSEFMFFRESRKRRALFLTPLLLTMFIIPLGIINFNLSVGQALVDATRTHSEITRHIYVLTELRVIATYLRLIVFPINLNFDYDYPVFHSLRPEVLASLIVLISLFLAGLFALGRSRANDASLRVVAFGIFWFFITISIESSVILLADVIFEHRLYLPMVGVSAAIATGAFLMLRRFRIRVPARLILTVFFAVPFVFGLVSYKRNETWNSMIALWSDTVSKSPHKARPRNNAGTAYYNARLFGKAMEHYNKSLEIEPDMPVAHINIGNIFLAMEQYERAIEHFRTAIAINRGYMQAYNNLGIAYGRQGLLDKEIETYQTALNINPSMPVTHNNLGKAYMKKGLHEAAARHFRAALRLWPDFDEARRNLAAARRALGRPVRNP